MTKRERVIGILDSWENDKYDNSLLTKEEKRQNPVRSPNQVADQIMALFDNTSNIDRCDNYDDQFIKYVEPPKEWV